MTTAEESTTAPGAAPSEITPPGDVPSEDAPLDGTDVRPEAPAAEGADLGDVLERELRRGAAMVDQVRDRLPAPVPVYLGVAALAVTGLVSWPVAVAVGCGYAAFRHWEPRPSGVPAPMPSAGRR
ncbi:hypothetical protein [Actinomycetospora straminea]|nr:hypothetical protein [Actinomycetospora straminea]MDD7933156.1 hypothetical protein [Actinomycetospora straminea]